MGSGGALRCDGAGIYEAAMEYQAYVEAMQRVARQVDDGQYDEALAGLQALLQSDLLDRDKSIVCVNTAVVLDKQGKVSEALAWYDRGIDYERPHHRHFVAEQKAAYLVGQQRAAEALDLYEALVRDRSIDEGERQRFTHNIGILRSQLGRA